MAMYGIGFVLEAIQGNYPWDPLVEYFSDPAEDTTQLITNGFAFTGPCLRW